MCRTGGGGGGSGKIPGREVFFCGGIPPGVVPLFPGVDVVVAVPAGAGAYLSCPGGGNFLPPAQFVAQRIEQTSLIPAK